MQQHRGVGAGACQRAIGGVLAGAAVGADEQDVDRFALFLRAILAEKILDVLFLDVALKLPVKDVAASGPGDDDRRHGERGPLENALSLAASLVRRGLAVYGGAGLGGRRPRRAGSR